MMDYGATVILNDIGYESLDALAGGETAGIPFAAWLAERTHLPMQYVRKKPKGFGRDARIEGEKVRTSQTRSPRMPAGVGWFVSDCLLLGLRFA